MANYASQLDNLIGGDETSDVVLSREADACTFSDVSRPSEVDAGAECPDDRASSGTVRLDEDFFGRASGKWCWLAASAR
jgi:hypothetical protein